MSQAYADAKFEVVMYSGSIDMVLKDKSSVAEDLEELAKNENITFVVCQGTMKRHIAYLNIEFSCQNVFKNYSIKLTTIIK
jgi:intracellular sulfur oxidation DsrE/DsrF family protein